MEMIGRYAFLGGVALAVLLAFVMVPSGYLILAVLGLIVGFLNITSEETKTFLLATIALMLSATSIGVIPGLGGWLAEIASNLAAFVTPAALVVALKSLLEVTKD